MRGLPKDAAVWRQDLPKWTQEDERWAELFELVDMWGRLNAQASGAKASKLPKPVQITRPNTKQTERRREPTKDPGAIAKFFQKRR